MKKFNIHNFFIESIFLKGSNQENNIPYIIYWLVTILL